MVIPSSVTEIGAAPFSGCNSLTSLVVDNENPKYDSRDNCNAILETSTHKLIQGLNTTIIPDNVTEIGDAAFASCDGIFSLNIPNGVSKIGNDAFADCIELVSINLPNTVTEIGKTAFMSCSKLQSMDIPNGVNKIGERVFEGCHSLERVRIPGSVSEIATGIFSNCESIIEIVCEAVKPPHVEESIGFGSVGIENFWGGIGVDPSMVTLKVPTGSMDAYKVAEAWKFFNIVEFDPTGIEDVESELPAANGTPTAIYTLNGKKVSETQKGQMYIFHYENGKAVKKLVK